jgi:acyl-coenzyme A thioesterase PaaI-like protein
VVTTLLDHACGQAVFAALGEPGTIATLDLRIDYMRAAEPGKALFCRAHCYKLTRSVAFVRASAYDDQVDDPVATAQAAFMLDSSAGRGPGANLRPPAAPRTDHKS